MLKKRKMLRVNVGKSEVMRGTRYRNRDRMNVTLNGEPLEDVPNLNGNIIYTLSLKTFFYRFY